MAHYLDMSYRTSDPRVIKPHFSTLDSKILLRLEAYSILKSFYVAYLFHRLLVFISSLEARGGIFLFFYSFKVLIRILIFLFKILLGLSRHCIILEVELELLGYFYLRKILIRLVFPTINRWPILLFCPMQYLFFDFF